MVSQFFLLENHCFIDHCSFFFNGVLYGWKNLNLESNQAFTTEVFILGSRLLLTLFCTYAAFLW